VPFDAATLRTIDAAYEVDIETTLPDDGVTSTIIWVMVEDDEVLVRSFRGSRGRWYQAALDKPDEVTLVVDGERIPVRAILADDEESIARCTAGLERKYAGDESLPTMLTPNVLATNLRLEPR
jgi:hypothetical protein